MKSPTRHVFAIIMELETQLQQDSGFLADFPSSGLTTKALTVSDNWYLS